MKRYTKRTKPAKVSKRQLEARLNSVEAAAAKAKQEAEWAGLHLRKARENLGLEQIRSRGYYDEAAKLREELEKVTEPAWRLARVHTDPAQDSSALEMMQHWRITGRCEIGIAVEFRSVRCQPQGDREVYLARLVEDFTKKARAQAKATLRVLLD
jgi:hypothetical protein